MKGFETDGKKLCKYPAFRHINRYLPKGIFFKFKFRSEFYFKHVFDRGEKTFLFAGQLWKFFACVIFLKQKKWPISLSVLITINRIKSEFHNK
jgi:hypothetical protein